MELVGRKNSIMSWKAGAYDVITKRLPVSGPVGKKAKQMNAGTRI
jgi:hypothetical protein